MLDRRLVKLTSVFRGRRTPVPKDEVGVAVPEPVPVRLPETAVVDGVPVRELSMAPIVPTRRATMSSASPT